MANTEPPIAELVYLDTGELFQLVDDDPDSPWQALGVCPKPTTVLDTIVYHIAHGALMHYPLWNILVFAWRNRHSFTHPEIDDAVDNNEPAPNPHWLPTHTDNYAGGFMPCITEPTRRAQYIPEKLILEVRSATMIDSALLATDDDSDSLLATIYGRDSLDVNDKFMQDGD